jgi:hypothetical protein
MNDSGDGNGTRLINRLCYGGPASGWAEKKFGEPTNETLYRRFDYYRPPGAQGMRLPLIIWSHPNGASESLNLGGSLRERLAVNATKNGFAFMSIQFRHPTSSQDYYPVPPAPVGSGDGGSPPPANAKPSTDIASAVQFARERASVLQIDSSNIFLVGQSRGSLALLTGLMADQKKAVRGPNDESYVIFSSKPRAVFAAQAQVTYVKSQISSKFLRPLATVAVSEAIRSGVNQLQYPSCDNWLGTNRFNYQCHYLKAEQDINNTAFNYPLSALDALNDSSLNTNGVPIWLRYERSPKVNGGNIVPVGLAVNEAGTDQTNVNIDTNTNVQGDDVAAPAVGTRLTSTSTQTPTAESQAP